LFTLSTAIFLVAALVIWFSPRPPANVDTSAAH
jgi:hypothetical protein